MIRTLLNPLQWILPFFCFCSGYFATRLLLSHKTVLVPALIGKTADVGLQLLSEKNLNPRIVGLIDEPDAEPGTILNQIPRAESMARPHQTIFLVLASRPKQMIAPHWIGMTQDIIKKTSMSTNHEPIFSILPHTTPAGTCFAQYPAAGMPIIETPTLYVSGGSKQTYIMPSFLGAPAAIAFDMLKKQGIDITIIGEQAAQNNRLDQFRITDQRPLPGSFVRCDTMHKPSLHVRLGK